MRYSTAIFALLCAATVAAADFTTGMAARLVIGQRTFTLQESGAGAALFGGVGGVAYANDTLVVADANRLGASPINHRILVFRNLSTKLPTPTEELAQRPGIRCLVCVGAADVVLGQKDFETAELKPASQTTMRVPTHVATDGRVLVVADTDYNRVLIWNSIPTVNQQPADVVVGQPDFQRVIPNDGQGFTPTNKSLKGPQGVWVQDGRLFVSDPGNNRVLIWNSIPRQNGQPADVVLGQPDFSTFVQPDLTKAVIEAKATTMLTPVSVTSDGTRLFVSDLGHNRILIWNSIPTRNQQPADVVVGQPDFESAIANNSTKLCPAIRQDSEGKDVFPARCRATVEFPRFALSDGRRLYVADGGNDRILVFNSIPAENGAKADAIIGQIVEDLNLISDSADPDGIASAAAIRTPLGLAWDGTNLFATDPFNRRILVFTPADRLVPNTGVRNSASREIFAIGGITFSGNVKLDDEVTVKIGDRAYKYKIVKDDTFGKVVNALVTKINAGEGDPQILATPNTTFSTILLTARVSGVEGNSVEYSVTASTGAEIAFATSGATLSGGQDAARVAPGTIVSVFGENLNTGRVSAPEDATTLPTELGGTQVYFDGIRAPLYFVSPTEIRAQVPVEFGDTQSINAFVRTVRPGGAVTVTTAVAVPIIAQNPGIFGVEGEVDPRPGLVFHFSGKATGTVSVDGPSGALTAGNTCTVTIEDRPYVYTVKEKDTLVSVRDGLIELINEDPKVEAFAAGLFTRIRLRARVPGVEGNGIEYSASANDGASVILTATTPNLCCANEAGARVSEKNPALPGETLVVFATGLGIVKPDEAKEAQRTGKAYNGPELNEPVEFVSSLAGGKTANVLYAGLRRGAIGIYEVHLELNSDIPTNARTQVTIAQSFQVSNIVTFPVFNPNEQPLP